MSINHNSLISDLNSFNDLIDSPSFLSGGGGGDEMKLLCYEQ